MLHYDSERQELVSRAARLAYPVRGGIPIMLASEARSLDEKRRRAEPFQIDTPCSSFGEPGSRPAAG